MDKQKEDNFWKPKSIELLAVGQGITGPQSLDKLTGAAADLWENDEEFDRFLTSIDRHRREATSA
jgi:hypothetical protein